MFTPSLPHDRRWSGCCSHGSEHNEKKGILDHFADRRRSGPDLWLFRGPQIRANEEAALAERLATRGLDPKKVGERVVDAIRTKTFYAFVSAVPADVIKAR